MRNIEIQEDSGSGGDGGEPPVYYPPVPTNPTTPTTPTTPIGNGQPTIIPVNPNTVTLAETYKDILAGLKVGTTYESGDDLSLTTTRTGETNNSAYVLIPIVLLIGIGYFIYKRKKLNV